MALISIAASTISAPLFVAPGSIVTVTPSAAATATVEYSTSNDSAVRNGVAVWRPWPKGLVASGAVSDLTKDPVNVRVTARYGAVSLAVDEKPSMSSLVPLRADWDSAYAQFSTAGEVISGLIGTSGLPQAQFAFDFPRAGRAFAAMDGTDGALALVSANGNGEAVDYDTSLGIPMVKCTLPSVAAATYQADYTLTTPIYIGAFSSIQIPFWFSDNTAAQINPAGYVQIHLYSEAGGAVVKTLIKLDYQEPGVLQVESIGRDCAYSGSYPLSVIDSGRITKIRIQIVTGTAPAGAVVMIGRPVMNQKRSKGAFTVWLDGEYASQQQYLLPILDAFDLKANIAITNKNVVAGSGAPGASMNEAQLAAAYANGHTIVTHTFGNKTAGWSDNTDYPSVGGDNGFAAIVADRTSGDAYLASMGWTRGIGHAVNGYTNAFYSGISLARQNAVSAALRAAGVKTCRVGGRYMATAGGVGQTFPHAHPNASWMRMVGITQIDQTDANANQCAQWMALADAAIDRGEMAGALLHRGVVDTAPPGALETSISNWLHFCEYLSALRDSGQLVVGTIDQLYSLKRSA